jgi:hypothetical protein
MLSTTSKKETIVTACIDALSSASVSDCHNEDAKAAVEEALHIINNYPGIGTFKNRVLKCYTPEHYVFRVQVLLTGISLMGETSPLHFTSLNEDLATALQLIQDELNG